MVNPFDLVDAESEDVLDAEDISKDIIVLIRKAAKKDMATRLKSLEELKLLLLKEEHQVELQSVSFAKHFLKLFSKVSLDPERRIREAAFNLLFVLCEDSNRRKCLNHIFADLAFYWIGAFVEPVGSISIIAKESFDICFDNPDKLQLIYKAINPAVRKMIKETIDFRAEEARQAAVSDPSLFESAQLLFSLHLVRAIGCAAFLSKYEWNEELCDKVLKTIDICKGSKLVNSAIYYYASTVKLPEKYAKRIIDLALGDVDNAFDVFSLLNLGYYASIVLDESTLTEYCRLCISSHPATLIPEVARLVAGRNSRLKSAIIISCLRPNTLDSKKLAALIEDLFVLADDDHLKVTIFDVVVKARQHPWNNLDVSLALNSLSTSFKDGFVETQLAQMDCSKSVPLILAARHSCSVDDICSSLQNLSISSKDIDMILSDPQLCQNERVIDIIFPKFVDCLNRNQLCGFIKCFDAEKLLYECQNKDAVLKFLSCSGTESSPWLLALKLSHGSMEIVNKMLSVSKYSDALMDVIESLHYDDFDASINQSWIESVRFCEYLITNGYSKLVSIDIARQLPNEFQITFVREGSDLFDFVDEQKLIQFNQKVCRSKLGWKRHYYLNLVEEEHDVQPFIDVSVLQTLTGRGFIRSSLCPHVAVYIMWIDDKYSANHQETIDDLIKGIDESFIEELSVRYGGYYSFLYENCCKTLPLSVSLNDCSDHSVAKCRLMIENADFEQCVDQKMRLSIMAPVVRKVSKDILCKTLAEDVTNPTLFAVVLTSIEDSNVISDNAESISRFISHHGLLATEFLSNHPEFLTPSLSSDVVKLFLNGDGEKSLCKLVRQIAPFNLDSFNAFNITPLIDDPVKSKSARFIFNLLHDSIICKLQSVLPSEQEDVLYSCLPSAFFSPRTIESFELLIGLAEASKEVPIVLATMSRTINVSSSLISHILETLGWAGDCNVKKDLSKTEFTVVDWDEEGMEEYRLSANVLFRSFRIFPQLMRKSLATFKVDAQVRDYISPMIIQRELDKCRRHMRVSQGNVGNSEGGDLRVKVLHSSTQCTIQAEYQFEDARLSINLEVPSSYPLTPLHIDAASGRKGVSEARWKSSLLSAAPILTAATDIMEGLRTWAANLNKQLTGIEPCAICYCVMHPTDRTLPSPQCRTCAHKFHSHCLYKWFRTGGQATCPLCRSLF